MLERNTTSISVLAHTRTATEPRVLTLPYFEYRTVLNRLSKLDARMLPM
jgi:hypothetical protein